MKVHPFLFVFALSIIAFNSKSPTSVPEKYVTTHTNLTQPVPFNKSQATLSSIPGNSGDTWTEISFDELVPRNMNIKECWNAMGMDNQGRIYIGFTSSRADGRDDFPVFRYDPRTGEKRFLGSFLDIVASAGNSYSGESIPKGHTRMIYANGRMYMGSQNFHDLKGEIDSLPTYRGSHLLAFDTVGNLWKDLSAALPGGVVTKHEGIISLNIMPKRKPARRSRTPIQ